MSEPKSQATAAIKQGAAEFAADLTAATHAGWRAGANAMRADALTSCGVILRLLETRAISGSAFDIVKALQKQIESSPIADVPETMQEEPHD